MSRCATEPGAGAAPEIYSKNLDCVLATADRAGFRRRRAESRRRGKLRGFGIGCFLETARGAPDEDAWLTFLPDGRVSMAVGTRSNGQGHETSFAQVLSGLLGLPTHDHGTMTAPSSAQFRLCLPTFDRWGAS